MDIPVRTTKPDVRARILDAALDLLHRAGVGALTQPRVAKAAGLRQSHLTYYFPTRIDLLQAVVQHSMTALASALAGPAREHGAAGARPLMQAIGREVADTGRARLILGLVVASDEDSTIKGWLREFIGDVREKLHTLPALADLDAAHVALLHTLLVGTAVLNVARDDAASRRESLMLVDTMLSLILDNRVSGKSPRGVRKSVKGGAADNARLTGYPQRRARTAATKQRKEKIR
jgi:AcrR family transcriptional regulator